MRMTPRRWEHLRNIKKDMTDTIREDETFGRDKLIVLLNMLGDLETDLNEHLNNRMDAIVQNGVRHAMQELSGASVLHDVGELSRDDAGPR